MWTTIIGFLGGPVIRGLLDAYNAHLKATTDDKAIAADLAGKEIAAQTAETQAQAQLRAAQVGHPWEPEKLFAYVTLIYYAKLLIWDKVIGSFMGHANGGSIFATDGLTSYDAIWGGLVITYYFSKRGFENVVRILRR